MTGIPTVGECSRENYLSSINFTAAVTHGNILQKYTFEFVVIFVSILASFWVEQWRQDRQTEEKTKKLLIAVSLELKGKTKSTETFLLHNHTSMTSADLVFKNFSEQSLSNDSLLTLVIESEYVDNFDPTIHAWESIVASGNIDLINSQVVDSVNSLLAQYRDISYSYDMIDRFTLDKFYNVFDLLHAPAKEYSEKLSGQSKSNSLKDFSTKDFIQSTQAVNYYYSKAELKRFIDKYYFNKLNKKERRLIDLIEHEVD